jgi:hypothetical protein
VEDLFWLQTSIWFSHVPNDFGQSRITEVSNWLHFSTKASSIVCLLSLDFFMRRDLEHDLLNQDSQKIDHLGHHVPRIHQRLTPSQFRA